MEVPGESVPGGGGQPGGIRPAGASRLVAFPGRIRPICFLVTPSHAGAAPVSMHRCASPPAPRRGHMITRRGRRRRPAPTVPAAFERRCIPPDCVVRRLPISPWQKLCCIRPEPYSARERVVQRSKSPKSGRSEPFPRHRRPVGRAAEVCHGLLCPNRHDRAADHPDVMKRGGIFTAIYALFTPCQARAFFARGRSSARRRPRRSRCDAGVSPPGCYARSRAQVLESGFAQPISAFANVAGTRRRTLEATEEALPWVGRAGRGRS